MQPLPLRLRSGTSEKRLHSDHDYIDVSERMAGEESADLIKDGGGHGLHGGLGANHVTVVWELHDVGPEDGGAGTYPRHLPP